MNGMVSCKSCMAHNSLDSAFCKKCGTTLPADDLQQAREKLETAVADGYRVFSAGRTDEAIQIADTAVQANPSSTAALSLKAMCHDRLGQISEALECHEKVLEIDPDSMIDKIKVNDLRNLLVARTSIAAVPDRRMATIVAVAAGIFILSIGLVVAKNGSKTPEKVALNTPSTTATGAHFDPIVSTQPLVQSQPQTQSTPPANNVVAPQTPNKKPENTDRGNSRDNGDSAAGLPDPTRSLPRPDREGGNIPITLDPLGLPKGPVVDTTAKPQPPVTPPVSHPIDPAPNPDGPTTTKQAPGIMEITVVKGGAKGTDSADPAVHTNGVQALLHAAENQYQIGNYSSAANSYERALRAGAGSARGNQRLAQCYEKLGKNSEAIAAYNRAIDSLQSELSSGRGDKDRVSAALDSCKQAVKVLGG